MPIEGLQALIAEAKSLAIGGSGGVTHYCLYCGGTFTGRPNKLYCGPRCKKGAENDRAKLDRLVSRQYELVMAEEKALQALQTEDQAEDKYHTVRMIRARRGRDVAEIETLLDKTALKTDPKVIRDLRKLVTKMEQNQPSFDLEARYE